jgi:hypothetical protein
MELQMLYKKTFSVILVTQHQEKSNKNYNVLVMFGRDDKGNTEFL